ncbi:MAG: hypothetical protein V3R74_02460, partial [Alphaproteobacteria bacterium]
MTRRRAHTYPNGAGAASGAANGTVSACKSPWNDREALILRPARHEGFARLGMRAAVFLVLWAALRYHAPLTAMTILITGA